VHLLYDVRNEDNLTYDAQGFALLFSCAEASIVFGRILPGAPGMDARVAEGKEDAVHLLGGVLSYPTGSNNDVFVSKGSWVVARPGETYGYWNKSGKPVSLFGFRAVTSRPAAPGSQRIFKPVEGRAAGSTVRTTIYETAASRGDLLALHPGEPAKLPSALCRASLVTAGRVMALFGREKISLDTGEGIAFVKEPVEIVGVGGLSNVILFSTIV
jgi:hypothetical protein